MNVETARSIADDVIANRASHSMAEQVQAYNALDAANEDDQAEALLQASGGNILNYDSRGNWTGPVANENGWTA